ncbi:MAG: hypothetical protein ABIR39_12195 [Nocardioides sp.]|uniref:hypothetical protein n=1 Tax=Nocardioides sp. TaxID=35761 RepID=UPI003262D8F9
MSTDTRYPAKYGACIMCGAKQGETCTVISGSGEPGDQPGDSRTYPHGNRTRPEQIGTIYDPARSGPFVAVKDEPDHYAN